MAKKTKTAHKRSSGGLGKFNFLGGKLAKALKIAAERDFRSVEGQASKYIIDGLRRDGIVTESVKTNTDGVPAAGAHEDG